MGQKSDKLLKETREAYNDLYKDARKRKELDMDELLKVWEAFDADKSGTIEGEEMSKFLDSMFDFMWDRLTPKKPSTTIPVSDALPADDPRRKEKMCTPPPTAEQKKDFVGELTKFVDPNDDKKITWEEFVKGMEDKVR
eukprot:CAMPEP_0168519194 /NCGR_PEP_ID=MMETSP0405-20121227/7169_1 /TAXON_ID=498012 /ORGANISM="Trichosphaerium sp, Strain Am-I-7 wt" /LENGTH=138 /DNA_ID=CAMNT_0008539683 /DNA_START=1498 /DNA_END=1914 /DNA_ORIENTATION=+